MPVLAVQVLGASEWEMGLLNAATMAAFLVIGLPAGAWVDRMRKRRVLIVADLVRAVVLAGVVAAALTGVASMPLLYVAALAISAATVFFDVSHQSYVPGLVGLDHVVEGNSKLQSTASVAMVAGPALGGQLLRIVSAPFLIGINAVLYAFSAFYVARIRHVEELPARESRRPLVVEIREGLAFVGRQPLLRRMVACTSIGNLFGSIGGALEAIYILRLLGISEATFGTILSAGAIGGLLGAVSAERIARWVGEARVIPVTAIGWAAPLALVPLASVLPIPRAVTLVAALGLTSFLVVVYNVATVSFRQRLCPPALLGRMNASVRFIVWGSAPLGGLLGGWLGTSLGVVPALWIGVAGALIAAVPVLPLLRMTELPTPEGPPAAPPPVAPEAPVA